MVAQVSNMELARLITLIIILILLVITAYVNYKKTKELINLNIKFDNIIVTNEDVPDYLLRMYDEFKELVNRLVKLRKFVKEDKTFKNLDAYRKEMLLKQLQQMEDYADTLECRIAYEENLLKTNNK